MPPARLMKCHYEVLEAPRYVRREFNPPDGVLKRGRNLREEERMKVRISYSNSQTLKIS